MSDKQGPAFDLKGTAATLTVLRLRCADPERIAEELRLRVAQLPHFFQNAPVVLDVEALDKKEPLPFDALVTVLRDCSLVPVAVRHAEGDHLQAALAAGLGVLKGGSSRTQRARSENATAVPTPQEASAPATAKVATAASQEPAPAASPEPQVIVEPAPPSLTVKSPVRGGQVVYAAGTDLVLLAPVNPGGEIIADGNIHAYAPIRGRALAGAHGNEDARIFCKNLDAELVSVAGRYLSADEIGETWRGKAAQVRLEGETLVISDL
ncbi:MAG: septum site-determining protein MinC [Deltaproteobacteria bacterium]|nr:septum site-determining protein MinC [Deltaproteobacteria bacterium]